MRGVGRSGDWHWRRRVTGGFLTIRTGLSLHCCDQCIDQQQQQPGLRYIGSWCRPSAAAALDRSRSASEVRYPRPSPGTETAAVSASLLSPHLEPDRTDQEWRIINRVRPHLLTIRDQHGRAGPEPRSHPLVSVGIRDITDIPQTIAVQPVLVRPLLNAYVLLVVLSPCHEHLLTSGHGPRPSRLIRRGHSRRLIWRWTTLRTLRSSIRSRTTVCCGHSVALRIRHTDMPRRRCEFADMTYVPN